MKPAAFEMHAPDDVAAVVALLAEYGDEAKVLAGGQSLAPMLALRLARFEHLVDLNRVGELSGISRMDGHVRIGAMTRHFEVEQSDEVVSAVPLLSRATAKVGHFQIRNRGTLGGSVAHADPAGEQPAVCVALDAVMEVCSAEGTRHQAASDFFRGTWATALGPGEILSAVRFPVWSGRCGFAVEEMARRSGDFAIVGVVSAVEVDPGGAPTRAAVALFGVGATPVRAGAAEAALLAGASPAEAARAAIEMIDPSDDLHASGFYRRKVAAVLVERAVDKALKEAGNA